MLHMSLIDLFCKLFFCQNKEKLSSDAFWQDNFFVKIHNFYRFRFPSRIFFYYDRKHVGCQFTSKLVFIAKMYLYDTKKLTDHKNSCPEKEWFCSIWKPKELVFGIFHQTKIFLENTSESITNERHFVIFLIWPHKRCSAAASLICYHQWIWRNWKKKDIFQN